MVDRETTLKIYKSLADGERIRIMWNYFLKFWILRLQPCAIISKN